MQTGEYFFPSDNIGYMLQGDWAQMRAWDSCSAMRHQHYKQG